MCCYSQHPEIHWIFQGYFTVQLSRFFVLLSFSATAYLLYLIKSVLSRTFFIFWKFFFQSVWSDLLSQARQLWYLTTCSSVCQELFCFILEIFPKSCCPLSNHVLSSGQLDYNTTRILFCQPFFNTFFSLASEQQRLNFTLLWNLVLPKSWFSKWNSFFNPQHTSFFFCLLHLYAFSASIRHFWCPISQMLHKWLIYVLTAFNQPRRKMY